MIMTDAETIAFAYVEVLRKWLTDQQFCDVGSGTVHPDDLCDGNAAMALAFKIALKREHIMPFNLEDSSGKLTPENQVRVDDDLDLFNEAYDLALKFFGYVYPDGHPGKQEATK